MEFEKFIGGKFKMSTLPYMLSKRLHDVKLLVALGKSFSFLVLMVCNLRQDTFIDYLISECGLGQITASLMIFFLFQCCAALGRTLLLIILLPLLYCGRANHFTFFMLCNRLKALVHLAGLQCVFTERTALRECAYKKCSMANNSIVSICVGPAYPLLGADYAPCFQLRVTCMC
jgi:hypothetical protein